MTFHNNFKVVIELRMKLNNMTYFTLRKNAIESVNRDIYAGLKTKAIN